MMVMDIGLKMCYRYKCSLSFSGLILSKQVSELTAVSFAGCAEAG